MHEPSSYHPFASTASTTHQPNFPDDCDVSEISVKMAYILTGPGDIVNRIVDIAKVVRLCSDTVLSFFKFQLNNRPSE